MRAADLFEHFALHATAGKPAKLGNEFAHRAMAPEVTIPGHVRGEIALQPSSSYQCALVGLRGPHFSQVGLVAATLMNFLPRQVPRKVRCGLNQT